MNKQPERSVEEIVEEFKELMADVFKGRKSALYAENWLTQALQAERQRCDEMMDAERKRILGLIGEIRCDLLHHKKSHQHDFTEPCPVIKELTQPTSLTNDKE
jgi:hypothetical protein